MWVALNLFIKSALEIIGRWLQLACMQKRLKNDLTEHTLG